MNSTMYFRHDLYALESDEMIDLVAEFHGRGYGVWWTIVERLSISASHRIRRETLAKQVAIKLGEATSEVLQIIDHCLGLGILETDGEDVWNDRVIRQCEAIEAKSNKNRENANKRWREAKAEPEPVKKERIPDESSRIVDEYHRLCPSLPKVIKVTDARKTHANSFTKEFSPEQISEGFRKAEESEFLHGANGKWSGANFDWLVNKTNFTKVLEGCYDNKKKTSPVCNTAEDIAKGMDFNGGFRL